MSRKLSRKAILLFVIEIISLIVMGVFLTAMQSRLSLNDYQADISCGLGQLETLLSEADQERQDTIATDDAIYQAKVESIRFLAENDKSYRVSNSKMQEYADLLQVDNVLILDKEGNQLAKAQDTEVDFTRARFNQLRTVFETGEPAEPIEIQTDNIWERYYSAKIDAETMAVVENQPEELYQLLDGTVPQGSVLSNVSVGTTGYMIAVSGKSYEIEYHPDEEMIGKDALTCGISVDKLEDGNFSWMTIVITYGIFVMHDHEKSLEDKRDYKEFKRFCYDKVVGRKAAVLSFVGIICILVISFYMQTLFALSSQSISNNQHLDDVEKTMARFEQRVEELTEQYNTWYLNKCQIATYILENNRELIEDEEKIGELSDILQVKYIYVFDHTGTIVATNSTYNNFQVSQDPEDQSYEFNKLLLGGDYLIQEAQPDEASGDFYQYIGVSMHDEEGDVDGFVQIAIKPEKLEQILQNMQLSNVLDGIQVGRGGFAFAINKEDGTFAYYPDDKLVGRQASDYGIEEDQIKAGYSDYLKIQSERYYCGSIENGDYYVYIAVPEENIMTQRVPLTLATGLFSLVCMIIIFLALTFGRSHVWVEVVDGSEPLEQTTGLDKRMIDVPLPDGRVKKTESAESRWTFLTMKWGEKTAEQQIASVVKGLFGTLSILICIGVLFKDKFFGSDSLFTYIIDGGWEKGINVFAITACILVIGVVTTATTLIKKLLKLLAITFGARGETICRMISSFIKYLSVIAMLYYCFALFGVDTATLLASAGILSIAISLGAKDMVGDILAGLFIIFEGEFRVGDVVNIGGWIGTVLEIGIRTTKIEDGAKNIKIIRNSNVSDVINMTKHTSFASCDMGIEYGESLERVENIFEKEFPNIKERFPAILDGPFYKGVVALADNSVNVRIVAQCREQDRVQLERDLNREMKLIFDKYDINIPFPQVVINQPIEFKKATEWEKRRAEKFTDEQKIASKDIGNEDERER